MSITRVPFEDVFADESGGNIKTLQSDYKAEGRFPVVDQGKALIAGYVDDEKRICGNGKPAIIFGDHTRRVKFMDAPFCMGADGVKVLRPKIDADLKYLYYYLKQLRLPDAGYDRHFKYLKRVEVVILPLFEQRRIAAILDKVDTLRTKRREALVQLDRLAQSFFLDMFGDPKINSRGWPIVKLGEVLSYPLRNGISPSKSGKIEAQVLTLSAVTGSRFDETSQKPGIFKSEISPDHTVNENDFLICRGNGNLQLVGKGDFPARSMPGVAFPDTIIAARISLEKTQRDYLRYVWGSTSIRDQIESLARTTNGTYKVNQTVVEGISFISPPIHLQNEFGLRIAKISRLAEVHRRALKEINSLFSSLQHRAFQGKL
ncbi:restriction endonuclease subunit S [Pseudomonas izuensis]|uniref:restriction endonuclease subunit S n=1 Tax=Pseudomonas izuensis TaxID=2684212 RepID=UPI00135AFA66|nr:restriction endonuclease subunit S [Pseudomonas izuensis]